MMRKGWAVENDSLEAVINAVKKLPIVDVLTHYGVKFEKHTGGRALSLCPFHMDNHIGSFSVNIATNRCWCYACNQGGNVIVSVSKMLEKPYVETALQIACDEGIIDEKQLSALSDMDYSRIADTKREVAEFKLVEPEEKSSKTKALYNNVYAAFKAASSLSEAHREHLQNKRSLSKERIEKDYFTIPVNVPKTITRMKELLNGKYSDEEISKVPGFCMERVRDEWKLSFIPYEGIGILMRDMQGLISGIQVRLDKDTSPRYFFMSGTFNGNSEIKGGGSIGTPISFEKATRSSVRPKIAVVEGKFKAEILAQNGFDTFSVQGVNNFRGLIPMIKKLPGDKKEIYTFYDADLVKNPQVAASLIKLIRYLQNGLVANIHVVLWDYENGKGIDDLILNGLKQTCFEVTGAEFVKVAEGTFTDAIAEAGYDSTLPASKFSKTDRDVILSMYESLMKKRFNIPEE